MEKSKRAKVFQEMRLKKDPNNYQGINLLYTILKFAAEITITNINESISLQDGQRRLRHKDLVQIQNTYY